MDLTTATPREIDRNLADLIGKRDKAAHERGQYARLPAPNSDTLAEFDGAIATLNKHIHAHEEEFRARGGWNRLYVVVGGRVHSTSDCRNGYFHTTRWGWLPEWSDTPWDELVQAAGDRACSWCLPEAPSTPSKVEHADEAADREKREAREAEKARKKTEAETKAVVDPETGEWIRDNLGGVLKTERTVKSRAMDALWWSYFAHRSGNTSNKAKHEGEARRYSNALADKWGRDRDELYAELADKAWDKFRKGK